MTSEHNRPRIDPDLRQRAEEFDQRSAAQSPEDIESLSAEEIGLRFHELRVHQIELEMQNVQLRQLLETLESLQARYFDLYDLAPVGYCTISEKGLLQEANLKASNLLGLARAQLVGQRFPRFILAEDNDRYYLLRKQLFESFEPQECELRMVRWDGSAFWAHLSVTLVQDDSDATVILVTLSDITERKRSEQAVYDSEERFRSLMENIDTVAIQGYGPDGTTQYWNKASERLYGYSQQEAIGCNLLDLIIPSEMKDNVAKAIREMAESGQPIPSGELLLMHKDGSRVPVISHHAIVRVPDREQEIFCLDVDISERKRVEEALRESEVRLTSLLNETKVHLWVFDGKRYTFFNKQWYDFTGLKQSDGMTIETWTSIVHPDDLPKATEIWLQHWATKTEHDNFFRLRRHDGVYRDFFCHTLPLFDENGVFQAFQGVNLDITERKRAEDALKDANVVLAQKDALLRSMLHNLPFDFWARDLHQNMLIQSKESVRMWGDLTGTAIHEANVTPEYLAVWKATNARVLSREVVASEQAYVVCGEPRQFHAIVAPILMAEDVQGILGINIDITELKQAEEERVKLQTQLQQAQKMEAIGTLAGGIAHDFNNILGAIVGFTEIACDCIPPESEATQHLEKVQAAAHRASALVKQILVFSRQANIERIPLKPASIIKEAIKLLRPSLPSTITIKHDINSSDGSIIADPTQVHQILMNLCTNAFHAMEQFGGTLEIILKDCELTDADFQQRPEIQPGTFVVLSIGDTGVGIEADIRDKIFEPYFTTKEVGKGTGMGLAISHGIVASYGGFISCESEIGRGTVFRVFFPAIEEVILGAVQPVDVVVSPGKERILLVDDEKMLADLGKVMLEHLGYAVTSLASSQDALNLFRNQPDQFDVVITDQTMPGITGMDLSRQILQIRPDIPIILCTGYSRLIHEEKAKSEGIKGFIEKPMTRKDIATLLRKVLNDEPCA